METKIIGNDFPAVVIKLNKGESVYSQSGGMSWQTDKIETSTNMKGGFLKSIARSFTGESLFMATFLAKEDNQEIAFASTFPGEIKEFNIENGKTWICQKDAFLVAEDSVKLETTFTKKFGAGLFGGEGFILQKLSGFGKAFIESSGTVIKKELEHGEVLLVDTGNVVAFEESIDYSIQTVKGVKNILFGGEGLFLTKLVGPGTVYLQTTTVANMAAKLNPFMIQK